MFALNAVQIGINCAVRVNNQCKGVQWAGWGTIFHFMSSWDLIYYFAKTAKDARCFILTKSTGMAGTSVIFTWYNILFVRQGGCIFYKQILPDKWISFVPIPFFPVSRNLIM